MSVHIASPLQIVRAPRPAIDPSSDWIVSTKVWAVSGVRVRRVRRFLDAKLESRRTGSEL
jgi:hypothetical protein